MNITRKKLYNRIHQNLGFSKNIASQIVDDFFELLIDELIKKKKVKISSFGTFKVINKKGEKLISPFFIPLNHQKIYILYFFEPNRCFLRSSLP